MQLIGHGQFGWNGIERRSDRYGLVRLFQVDQKNKPVDLFGKDLEGQKGRLIAHVIKSVQSEHMGDMFRGIKPPNPPIPIGSKVLLGEGYLCFERVGEENVPHELSETERRDRELQQRMTDLFLSIGATVNVEKNENSVYDQVGLKPEDGRETDWLDPNALYQVHDQIVDLFFEFDPGEK
jgi:hypothetical protein